MSTTTSTSTSLSGIFAKFVAKFLVKWIKKTFGIGQADRSPALTATPSQVTGRPERDRSRENFGAHTGSQGARADESPTAAEALQGDDYGAHSGSQDARAFEDPGTAQAIRGDDYGAHRGVLQERPYQHLSPEQRRAAMWTGGDLERQREVLRQADPQVLRDYGLNDKQVSQCRNGRVPSGHVIDQVATNGMARVDLSQQNWVLSPTSPENQLLANSFHNQLIDIRIGETRILSVPLGGNNVVLVLGAAS
ncbi:hypothetical protein GCM10028820_18660 [Tessaracoccus terricola]